MVIYLDVLFAVNLLVDYFLLLATASIARQRSRFWRLLLGAAAGALSCLWLFLPISSAIIDILARTVFACVVLLIAFGFLNLKRFLTVFLIFFAITFAFGGIMSAVESLLHPSGMVVHNGVAYMNIPPLLLVCVIAASYLLTVLFQRFTRHRGARPGVYEMIITLGGEQARIPALLDTGHELYDVFSGWPVVVVEYAAVERILPPSDRLSFASLAGGPPKTIGSRYRVIPYRAVGGEGLLPSFRPDSVALSGNGINRTAMRAVVAVTAEPMRAEYRALFSAELLNLVKGASEHDTNHRMHAKN